MKKAIILSFFSLLLMAVSVSAQCTVTVNAQDTDALMNEISSIDNQLSNCPQNIPVSGFFVGGDIVVEITGNPTEHLTLEVQNNQLTGVSKGQGQCKNKLSIARTDLDTYLSSNNKARTFMLLYTQKKISVKGCTIWRKFLNFFVQPVGRFVAKRNIPPATPQPQPQAQQSVKPDDCEDTYLPGHREYAQNKELWDRYSSDSQGVCQSMKPVSCKHNVQLSVQGTPYYLCWY